ncbi:olfactory receptor 14K1-like [Tachyglossus aculeatus]|uniref:olfactory receptor 14K1-like n=1 Tax=Tachyglossus aculeatus TaxID=9261 RepID=UPI0018F76B11|nr:olfactory receptor 14K1-like [Tachyglossus aculeatus]
MAQPAGEQRGLGRILTALTPRPDLPVTATLVQDREDGLVQAALILFVYLAALMENLLIVVVTTLGRHLHTPIYFLSHLDVHPHDDDLYSAICHPLCYEVFCDIPSLLTFSCSENHVIIHVSVAIGSCLGFVCLVSIIVSYASIFSTVLRIPSAGSWSKAFSACLPHLLVVTVFLTMSNFYHLKPPSDTSPTLHLLVSVFHTVVPRALNPLICSLRNRDVKAALEKLLGEQ